MTAELVTIVDFIRYGASRFATAELAFGHLHDTAIDEATYLVLGALHLPPDLPPAYTQARLTADECQRILALIDRRIAERKSVGYLVGEAWFAGVKFRTDERALVARSPLAELIEDGFAPWLNSHRVERALDLCNGSKDNRRAADDHRPHAARHPSSDDNLITTAAKQVAKDLGFPQAIMLEDGCEQFLHRGRLGQVRFPGNISANLESPSVSSSAITSS